MLNTEFSHFRKQNLAFSGASMSYKYSMNTCHIPDNIITIIWRL